MNIQLGFSFLAGLMTTLSPCVLPVLPLLLGSAVRKNARAPLYMIIGLDLGFILVGVALSRFGSVLNLDPEQIRVVSSVLLILTSFIFLSSTLQEWLSEKLNFLANAGNSAATKWHLDESSGMDSIIIGLLLGVVWSPCAGPTLGVAVSLASQNETLIDSFTIMAIYAIGAAIPMLLISYGLRTFFQRYQKKIINLSQSSKTPFGILLLFTGVFIFIGLDKSLETQLLNHLPEKWVDLITKY